MKILSSVNIVVKDGCKFNLSDLSLYGKIIVENVYLDGKLVEPPMYKVKSGSTIVEFTNEFKNSLTEGNHNLEFKFKSGYAKTQILVLYKKEDAKKDKNKVIQTKQKNIKLIKVFQKQIFQIQLCCYQ